MTLYDNAFYESRHASTVLSAQTVLGIVRSAIPPVRSAIDLGCGVGTWLNVLAAAGNCEVCGVDGPWVPRPHLKIPVACFVEQEFHQNPSVQMARRFDLAISLEVAEHLPHTAAAAFVASLTRLSDFVLFSAAVPYQGGTGHINEQWPNYWIRQFAAQGYQGVDIVRKRTWNNPQVNGQYKQNSILYVKTDRLADLTVQPDPSDHLPAEQYSLVFGKAVEPGIKKSLNSLAEAVRKRLAG